MRPVWSRALVFLIVLEGAGIPAAPPPPALQDEIAVRPLVIYLEDGPFVTETRARDEGRYLPLIGLLRRMTLPYTDATGLETLTVRGPRGVLEAASGSATIEVDGRSIALAQPAVRETNDWVVGLDFLNLGLAAITGVDFNVGPLTGGAPARIVAGNVSAVRLDLEAVQVDGLARLTLRSNEGINVRVQQSRELGRVVLTIDRAPIIPSRESLDFRNPSIRSIVFDDQDGQAKVVIATSPELANVRLVPMDENRTFLVEFVSLNAPPEVIAAFGRLDASARLSLDNLRVLVIDPGHGGLDQGTHTENTLEKDLTLTLARRLRTRLQGVLDGTVILTRDQDVLLTAAERTAIANANEADLLVSFHVGFSQDPNESAASLFVMQGTGEGFQTAGSDELFEPWFTLFRPHLEQSRRFGLMLGERLREAIPVWEFAIREAPLAVLMSATMPALLVELGNANNAADLARLNDEAFQERLIEATTAAIVAFGGSDR